MIDNHLNQTYGIIDSQLHFLDIYNLIYQIDQTNQVIQFYEYLPIQSYLKPKLNKYLHLFEVQDQFKVKKQKQLCLKVLKDDNKEQSLLDSKIVLQNNCSTEIVSRKQSSILKPLNTIMNLQNKENDSIRVNIWNYDQITEPCYQKLQLLYFKEKIQIKFLELPFFILFQIGTSFCFYDCIQNIVAKSLNLEKFDVLQAYKSYYVIEKNTNYIQIIQALLKPFNIQSLYLDEVIINTQQLYQCIVIYMNNTKLPYLIKQKSYLGMYLNQNLYQPEKIVSYFDFTDIIFIQYPNLLALEIQGHIKTYQMQDILILRIKSYDSNRFFSILSINYQTNSLIQYQYEEKLLHEQNKFNLVDYQFSSPIKYSLNQENLVIQIEQGNSLYLAIFQIQLYLVELIDIIEIDDSYFEFVDHNLVYFNNKELRKTSLSQLLIKVEIQSIARNRLFSNYLVPLNITNKDLVNLNLIIENKCVELFATKNSFYIVLEQKQLLQINISDYFYGPICNLTLVSNSSVKLTGPLQLNTQIKKCSLYTSTFCLKEFIIKNKNNKSQILTLTAIINENLNFEIVEFDHTFLQIFQIQQGYLLSFSKLDNNLQIQLMQCFEDIQDYCIIQQSVTQNLKVETINNIDIKRSGNLIEIKNQINHYYIYIQEINFSQISILGKIIDYLYIEQSQDQYLFLQKNDQIDLELRIYQVNFQGIKLVYSQILTEQLITILNQDGTFSYQGQIIQLQECNQFAEQINLRLLMIDQFYSYMLALKINKKSHFIQIEILKQIRNLISIDFLNHEKPIFYSDESILILHQQFETLLIFYDLRENRQFYDSIYCLRNSIRIKKLNTTHYVFINKSEIFLGKVGYEIEFQSYEDLDEDIILIAQNDVSQQQVSLTIHFDQQNFIFQCNLILIIQVIALILIIFYLRIKKSHRKGLRSFKQLSKRDDY